MEIVVKLFGPLAAACGRDVTVVVESTRGQPVTCATVRLRLAEVAPSLAGLLPACRLAVNGCYASEEQAIQEGDEVALIGLVSGG